MKTLLYNHIPHPNNLIRDKNLLYALRSSCHQAKCNFIRMNKNHLQCSLGCQTVEDQYHIFKNCPFLSNCAKYPQLEYIFGDVFELKEARKVFLPIEKRRKQLKVTIPPGEAARTQTDKAPDTSAQLQCICSELIKKK